MSAKPPLYKKGTSAKELMENQKQLESRLNFQEDRFAKLERQNGELRKEIAMLTAEKNEILSRLSAFAGEQMTRGNPDIADLSDPNRPTKLAEKWNSLYTGEWTDAYEELTHNKRKSQTQIVEKQLLEIAVLCYNQCRHTAEEQIKKLRSNFEAIENFIIDTDNDLTKSRRASSGRIDAMGIAKFIENIVDLYKQRRRRDPLWKQSVIKRCTSLYIDGGGVHSKKVLNYVNKCAELCWYMNIIDPPLVIECESYLGQEIDRNKFHLYQGSGTKVDFIVWPALFLNRGDSLSILTKGTVQAVLTESPVTRNSIKRKGNDKMDDLVKPSVPIHKKDMRTSSASSKRSPQRKISSSNIPYQISNNPSIVDKASVASVSGVNVDLKSTTRQPQSSSRITNPERLLSHNPVEQHISKIKGKPDFTKSHRGSAVFVQHS